MNLSTVGGIIQTGGVAAFAVAVLWLLHQFRRELSEFRGEMVKQIQEQHRQADADRRLMMDEARADRRSFLAATEANGRVLAVVEERLRKIA